MFAIAMVLKLGAASNQLFHSMGILALKQLLKICKVSQLWLGEDHSPPWQEFNIHLWQITSA